MPETLLERARKTEHKSVTTEELDLVLAYFRGELTPRQLCAGWDKCSHVTVVYRAASILRRAVMAKQITLTGSLLDAIPHV